MCWNSCNNRWSRNNARTGNGCGCGCNSSTSGNSREATVALGDYQEYILVPTSVFDEEDNGCGCMSRW